MDKGGGGGRAKGVHSGGEGGKSGQNLGKVGKSYSLPGCMAFKDVNPFVCHNVPNLHITSMSSNSHEVALKKEKESCNFTNFLTV